MSQSIPNVAEVQVLTKYLNQTFSLRLFSNDRTPAETDIAANYTVVSGGGYANLPLTFANWTIGTDGIATYNTAQDFTFTGATAAPGNVYGYYIVDAGGVLVGAERFDASVVPFVPANNSLIRVTPKIQAA